MSDTTKPDEFQKMVAAAQERLVNRARGARRQLEEFIQTLEPKPYLGIELEPVCKCKSQLGVARLSTSGERRIAVPYLCIKEKQSPGMSFILPTVISPRYIYTYMHSSLSGSCLLCQKSLYQDTATDFYYIEPRGWLQLLVDQLPCKAEKYNFRIMSLTPAAAEFYLLEYVLGTAQRLGDKKLEKDAAAVSERHIERISKVMLDYLYTACLGESRHVYQGIIAHGATPPSVPSSGGSTKHRLHLNQLMQGNPPNLDYSSSWANKDSLDEKACNMCKWHYLEVYRPGEKEGFCLARDHVYSTVPPPPDGAAAVLTYLSELFIESGVWRGSYGGPLWGTAARLGSSMVGSSKDRTVIDRLFNICHNGGTIFSKDTHHFTSVSSVELMVVLDLKASAQYPGHYVPLIPLVSNTTKSLYRRASELILERGECVLWAGEKRGTGRKEIGR